MASAHRPEVPIAILGRQRLKGRLQALHHLGVAADHQAEADLEAPDTARRALVDIGDAVGPQLLGAALVVVEVGVASVDDRVARRKQRHQGLDHILGDLAGRQHDPDRPRRRQRGDQILDGIGAYCAIGLQLLDRIINYDC